MSSKTIEVLICQPVPNVPSSLEAAIISAWEQAQTVLENNKFIVEDPFNEKQDIYQVSADFSEIRSLLTAAHKFDGGFTKYRQALRQDTAAVSKPVIRIALTPQDAPENTLAYYHAAAVLLQQLFLAMNISVPGSCQIIDAHYIHDETTSFDPPALQAAPFIDAYLNVIDNAWPEVNHIDFAMVWTWLEKLETSYSETAIYPINKVLFGLLELGQKSLGLSNKHSILVTKLLDMITTTSSENPNLVRARVGLILGPATNSITELYRLRDEHVKGARPFKRHSLRVHDYEEELLRHLRAHKSPVEEGVAILLAILQKLCCEEGSGYKFQETVSVLNVDDMLS